MRSLVKILVDNWLDEEDFQEGGSGTGSDPSKPQRTYLQAEPRPTQTRERVRTHRKKKKKRKKRLKTWQKVAIGVGIPVFIILVVLISVFGFMQSISSNMSLAPTDLEALKVQLKPRPADPKEPYYILVLGSDARPGETVSRSDVIQLCRLDPETKKVSILSIPRDTKVELEGYGTQKINAAMAYGGPAGAVAAVSEFVGVDITHFVLIDFESFTDIVDTLGGVTVNVPFETEFGGTVLEPGVQTLGSHEALAFVRCRYSYALGDFQRAANQRALLKAIAKKIVAAPINEIPSLVGSMSSYVDTDMTAGELIAMAREFSGVDIDQGVTTGQVPSTTATIDGISYVLTIEDQWADVRQKFIAGEVPFVDSSNQPAVID
jgi:LCP family protein required for cell wall assembly